MSYEAKQGTEYEHLLLSYLVDYGFFRNHKIKSYKKYGTIRPDLCCTLFNTIVECDGSIHKEHHQKLHDERRDEYLRSLGFNV